MSRIRHLRDLAGEIDQEYLDMANEFGSYQESSNLTCLKGCTKCCQNPLIEASALEMLPMALNIYDQGMADKILEDIENSKTNICVSLKESGCTFYQHRPSICRMFGAAGYSKKNSETELSVCRPIKESFPLEFEQAKAASSRPPKMSLWSARVRAIDPKLGEKLYPINQALKIILEKILLLQSYPED